MNIYLTSPLAMLSWCFVNKMLIKGTYTNIDGDKVKIDTQKIVNVEIFGRKLLLTTENGEMIIMKLNEEFQIGE